MSKKNLSYEKAVEELQQILQALQEEEISIDELSGKIKRASELIQWCQEKLRTAEEDLDELFDV